MHNRIQTKTPQITIAEFLEKAPAEMNLVVLAGNLGLNKREILSARIQKLGLALAGFAHYIHYGRIQIVGQSEIWYLTQLASAKRIEVIKNLDLDKICCILITKNLTPPKELIEIADAQNLPLICTSLISSSAINAVSAFLKEILAPQVTMHGVLLDMYGIGILLLGESGIGKSESALDLITRGHRLIADDAVVIRKIGEHLEGSSPELTYGHLEIRGLGIINIRDLFGVSSIGKNEKIELCIELKKWDKVEAIERIGLETHVEEIFEIKLAKFILPVGAGRNLSTLIETAVRVHLLRESGFDAAKELIDKHAALVGGQK